LGMLGVHGKLVKYVVHSSKRKNWKKIIFLHTLPKQQSTSFWSQGILGVKYVKKNLMPPFVIPSLHLIILVELIMHINSVHVLLVMQKDRWCRNFNVTTNMPPSNKQRLGWIHRTTSSGQ
jgi:hypothetical protein